MNLSRVFATALARRVAYVIVALLCGLVGLGTARADALHPTQTEAAAHCNAVVSGAVIAHCQTLGGTLYTGKTSPNPRCELRPANEKRYQEKGDCWGTRVSSGVYEKYTSSDGSRIVYHGWTTGCPAGSAPDPNDGYKCRTPGEICEAKNADQPKDNVSIYTGQKCVDGCVYGARPSRTGSATNGGPVIAYGGLGFTGETCATVDPPPPKKEKECITNPDGLTMCVKKNGDHCYEAGAGRLICWGPGETGTKSDNNVVQKRTPGTEPQTPPDPPPGETLNNSNKPTPTTTTTPSGTTINNTTNNYTTNFGTNGGPTNSGEPANGDPPPDEEEGEGNGIGGTGDCAAGYLPSGDPVLGATLTEMHKLRCLGDKTKTDNEADANALEAEIRALEGNEESDREGFFTEVGSDGGAGLNAGLFSMGSGSCPEFPSVSIPGTDYTFTVPTAFCTIGEALRALFILCAYWWAFRLVSE